MLQLHSPCSVKATALFLSGVTAQLSSGRSSPHEHSTTPHYQPCRTLDPSFGAGCSVNRPSDCHVAQIILSSLVFSLITLLIIHAASPTGLHHCWHLQQARIDQLYGSYFEFRLEAMRSKVRFPNFQNSSHPVMPVSLTVNIFTGLLASPVKWTRKDSRSMLASRSKRQSYSCN